MPRLRARHLLPLSALVAAIACNAGKDAPATAAANSPGGTVVISTPTAPDNLMPPITTSQIGQQVEDLVYQRLAVIGAGLNTVGDVGFTPDLATRWSWAADSLSIAFHLDSTARWHDGKPVHASDVVFTFAVYTDPKTASATAALLTNIDSVTAPDSVTAVAWFTKRNPSQFFDVVMQFHVLPAHLLATTDRATLASSPYATQAVGSGPFRVTRFEPTRLVELTADTTGGRRRASLDRVVFSIAPDPVTAFTRVAAGEADVFEAVRPDKVADVTKNAQLRLLVMPTLDYMYLGFNLVDSAGRPHPIFSDKTVRRALTMATDRRSIVANIYDTLAVQSRGPFTVAQPSADATVQPLAYSADSANVLLDAAGWKRGADSLRRKNGRSLSFGVLVPSTSVARMRAAVLLQEQFRRVGVEARVESTDGPTFFARSRSRKFDTFINTWSQDAGPANARDTWSSAGAEKGGNNYDAYLNPAFDAQLDSGLATFDQAAMKKHFAAAWRIIIDDAPAVWIAEPRRAMAVHSRIDVRGARVDAWWAGIATWRIPADKRIARDAPAGATR